MFSFLFDLVEDRGELLPHVAGAEEDFGDIRSQGVEVVFDLVEAKVESVLTRGLLGLYEVLEVVPVVVDERSDEVGGAIGIGGRERRRVVEGPNSPAGVRKQPRADEL